MDHYKKRIWSINVFFYDIADEDLPILFLRLLLKVAP